MSKFNDGDKVVKVHTTLLRWGKVLGTYTYGSESVRAEAVCLVEWSTGGKFLYRESELKGAQPLVELVTRCCGAGGVRITWSDGKIQDVAPPKAKIEVGATINNGHGQVTELLHAARSTTAYEYDLARVVFKEPHVFGQLVYAVSELALDPVTCRETATLTDGTGINITWSNGTTQLVRHPGESK